MAVVDVIDLTVSPPVSAIITIDDDEADEKRANAASYGGQDSKDKKNRKQRRRDERERERRRDERGQEPRRDEREREPRRDEPERERHERHKQVKEDQKDNGSWKHDKFLEEVEDDQNRRGEKRKRVDDARVTRGPRRREEPTPRVFLVDTNAASSSSGPSQTEPPPINPVSVEPAVEPPTAPVESPDGPHLETGLLLPSHVTVAADDLVSLLNDDSRLSPSSEASGIDFLDDDRAVGAPRYFHDTTVQAKPARSRAHCTKCGDDDHDFKSCPNMICITCGARNDHSSRSCPILRFCWNCKAKGHLAKDCPSVGNMNLRELRREDCERCGSWKHHGTNCPSLWRIYTYLTDAEREVVLDNRESKRRLGFDKGGEGYIARDHWCYNCGNNGHLGDDCETAPNIDRPSDHSAFGSFNELSGPFASPTSAAPQTKRPPREWEGGDSFDDGHGFTAEDNVGKRGRENAKAKAREAQKQLEADDDEPDWFNLNRVGSTKDTVKAKAFSRGKAGLPPKPPPTVIRFGMYDSSFPKAPLDSGNYGRPASGPSLRDRIDMGGGQPTESSHRDNTGRREMREREGRKEEVASRRKGSNEGRRKGYKKSDDEPRRDRDRGSRWRGGYER